MGSAGMKRKDRRHLPKVEGGLGDDDTARLFGRFRWGGFSPAGAAERFGFFVRQASRNGTGDGWRWGFSGVLAAAPILLGIALVIFVLTRVF